MEVLGVIVCCLMLAVNMATAEHTERSEDHDVNDPEVTRTERFLDLHALGGCPEGWTSFEGHCYIIPNVEGTWVEAETYCRSLKGYLAEIRSQAENQFVANLIKTKTRSPAVPRTQGYCSHYEYFARSAWVGLSDRANEGRFVWSESYTVASFANWMTSPRQPDNSGNEDCVEVYNSGDPRWPFQWNDKDCNCRRAFVCESKLTQDNVCQPTGNMLCTCRYTG